MNAETRIYTSVGQSSDSTVQLLQHKLLRNCKETCQRRHEGPHMSCSSGIATAAASHMMATAMATAEDKQLSACLDIEAADVHWYKL